MGTEEERSQTLVEWVLALLEERFPSLGSEHDEPVSGADTVDELCMDRKAHIQRVQFALGANRMMAGLGRNPFTLA